MDATALASAIAQGRTTAPAVMQATLAHANAQAGLGAVARLSPINEIFAPEPGPFAGVPMLAKDLGSHAKGLAPAAGSLALRKRVVSPRCDSDFFASIRAQGFVPIGLSTTPEFGFALSSEPPGLPPALNPFDTSRSAGGSSGGAAAAVASGIVAVAHATDAAGSIRVPAACCGLWGLKPSRGTTPMGPDFGNDLLGLVGEGVLCRSLRDLVAVFQPFLTTGATPKEPRIALTIPERCDPVQTEATRHIARLFEATGAKIMPGPALGDLGQDAHAIAGQILAVSLAEWLDAYGIKASEVSPLAAANAKLGQAMTGTQVFALTRRVQQFGHATAQLFTKVDAILMPIVSGPPPPLGTFPMDHSDVAGHLAKMEAFAPNAALANVAGQSIVRPSGHLRPYN